MLMTRSLCVRILLALVLLAPLGAQSPGAFVDEYVHGFNTGEDAMRQFFEKYALPNPPVEARLNRYREMRQNWGELKSAGPARAEGDGIHAVLRDRSGEAFEFTFRLSGGKLMGIQVEGPIQDASAAAPAGPPLDEKAALAAASAAVEKRVAADEFSGAVLIARGQRVVLETARGFANSETQTPNATGTLFNIGSIPKIFTKLAVAALWRDGKLKLDDTIAKVLPDYPNKDAAATVTVAHLLNMQSGIGDFFGPKYAETPKNNIRTLAGYLELFASEALAFAPGTKQEYSNGGYVVLGLLIERAAGMSYYDYVRKVVFEPAGMTRTSWPEMDIPTRGRATGYTRRLEPGPGNSRRSNIYSLPARGSSAGGAYSTVGDLLKFAVALQAGKFVVPNAPADLQTGGQAIGIAGGAPGLNAAFEMGVGPGYTIIVMSNYDPPAAEALGRELRGVFKRVRP